METAMRNVSINDRTTPSMSPLIKTEPSSLQQPGDHLIQDQPIDFSTKVRVQNIIDSGEDSSIRKVSNDSAIDCSNDAIEESRTADSELSLDTQSQSFPSQSRIPMPNISSFLPQTSTSMGGMGMFYPQHPVFPNFLPPGFSAGPMWPNPMAAMVQQQQEVARKMLSASGKVPTVASSVAPGMKPLFGHKHSFTKQEMPLLGPGGRPFHTMPSFPNSSHLSNIPDPNMLAEALKNHEEMFTAYKQQVLSQKAAEDAKKSSRRQAPSTVTNGSHSSHSNGIGSSLPESFALSQINEDQTFNSPHPPSTTAVASDHKLIEGGSNGHHLGRETQSSPSDDDKHSGSGGSIGEGPTNGDGHTSGVSSSAGPSLHSSDESLQTNDSRRSLPPAYSSNGELNDLNGMRPRSMTLPTQSDHRLLSHSPSPSVLSTGNSSGPGTPNSKTDRGFRKRARTLPDDQKDEAYWERRRKNNEAAKRSRDSRRAKEDEIAIRAAFLEQENIRLRIELAALKTQTAKLRSELVIFQCPEDRGAGSAVRPREGS